MRIIIFGDSITEGMWDYDTGGWVHMLKINYWDKYGYDKLVYNFGVSGYTSEHVIKIFQNSFNSVCRKDLKSQKEAKVIFSFGINDASIFHGTGKNKVSLEKFRRNVQALIDTCQREKLIHNVIFTSAINIDEMECNRDISRWSDHIYYNDIISQYNEILQNLARETTCGYIDIFGIMVPEDFVDGLHPNAQGHNKIYKKIENYLDIRL